MTKRANGAGVPAALDSERPSVHANHPGIRRGRSGHPLVRLAHHPRPARARRSAPPRQEHATHGDLPRRQRRHVPLWPHTQHNTQHTQGEDGDPSAGDAPVIPGRGNLASPSSGRTPVLVRPYESLKSASAKFKAVGGGAPAMAPGGPGRGRGITLGPSAAPGCGGSPVRPGRAGFEGVVQKVAGGARGRHGLPVKEGAVLPAARMEEHRRRSVVSEQLLNVHEAGAPGMKPIPQNLVRSMTMVSNPPPGRTLRPAMQQ